MIAINSAPSENLIVLDGNNTIISITSSNGLGYYFRAVISIDGVEFDQQSWSRKNAFTAEKNLKNLYQAYFETVFNSTFTPGILEQTHLKKRVSIIINEYRLSDDSLQQSITLPDFFILYSQKGESFEDSTKIKFLGVDSDKLIVPKNGKLAIPFYVNTDEEDEGITVTLKDNFDTVHNTHSVTAGTFKRVYLSHFNFADLTLVNNTVYFTVTITVGASVISKVIRLLRFPDFEVKELVFQNNFGFYLYAYLDGQMMIDNAYDINSYDQFDGSEKIFKINTEQTYSINTGSFIGSEKEVINQIASSIDCKLFFNNKWIDIVSQIKKVKLFQNRLNNYSEGLSFTVRPNTSIDNYLADTSITPSLVITNVTTTDGENYVITFTSNFYMFQLFSQFRRFSIWYDAEILPGTTSPQTASIVLGGGLYYVRIYAMYNGEFIYSNIFDLPEWP